MNKQLCAIGLAALVAVAGNAQAQTAPSASPVRFFVGIGATFGGDKLATATFSNGDSAKIRAGGTVQFHGGLMYHFTDKVSASVGVGYHFDQVNATNGSITFKRVPLELLGHYAVLPNVRLGGGLRAVSGAKLDGGGVASGINASLGSATGLVLEGEYLVSPSFGIKLRAVQEDYKPSGASKVDGGHMGVMFNYYF